MDSTDEAIHELHKFWECSDRPSRDALDRVIAELMRLRGELKIQDEANNLMTRLQSELAHAILPGTKSLADVNALANLHAEVEKLKASQFRWIAVNKRMPTHNDGNKDGDVFWKLGRYTTAGSWNRTHEDGEFSIHWAPIPPLPEPPAKTQEEKDEEAWDRYVEINNIDKANAQAHWWYRDTQRGFLAGLKAAREAKP